MNPGFFGAVRIGGIELFAEFEFEFEEEDGSEADDCFAEVSDDPVSIWTTCLKEDVSAWTKVVGYGLVVSDLEIVFGVSGGVGFWITDPLLLLVGLVPLLLGEFMEDGFSLSWILELISIVTISNQQQDEEERRIKKKKAKFVLEWKTRLMGKVKKDYK